MILVVLLRAAALCKRAGENECGGVRKIACCRQEDEDTIALRMGSQVVEGSLSLR